MKTNYISFYISILMICTSLISKAAIDDASHKTTDTNSLNNYIKYCFDNETIVPFAIFGSLDALEICKKIKYTRGIDKIENSLKFQVSSSKLIDKILNNNLHVYMTLYDSLGYYYLNNGQEEKAFECFESIKQLASRYDKELSERLNKSVLNGIAGYYNRIGIKYINQKKYDISIEQENKAIDIYKSTENRLGLSSCYINIASAYILKGKNIPALDYLVKSLKINEELKYKSGLARCYLNIGSVYTKEKDYAKALDYFQKALVVYKELKNKGGIFKCNDNIGSIYSFQGSYVKAIEYYNEALKICEGFEEKQRVNYITKIENNIGYAYMKLGNYDKALECFNKALKLNENQNDKINKLYLFDNIANTYFQLKRYNEALDYAIKSTQSATELKELSLENNGYRILKEIYKIKGNYKKAIEYSDLYKSTADSLYNLNKSKQLVEIQSKYETEKKEKSILLLSKNSELQNLKIRKNKLLIYVISGGSLLILIFSLILLNFYRQKQFRKELFSKTIETEEGEKKRFAEDLHDGLGPLLSTIGLYINELGDAEVGKQKEELLKTSNQLIDDAIKSTKLIANNLMPGDLSQYGLIHAIENYCTKVNNSGKININLKTEDTKGKLKKTTEIILYRVLMELINNTIKHASAKNIDISIKEKDNKIMVDYKDDGKGFNVDSTLKDATKGLGLNNIINRIKSIEGECVFESLKGKGTITKIEINLK